MAGDAGCDEVSRAGVLLCQAGTVAMWPLEHDHNLCVQGQTPCSSPASTSKSRRQARAVSRPGSGCTHQQYHYRHTTGAAIEGLSFH